MGTSEFTIKTEKGLIKASGSNTLLEALRDEGMDISAPCGGNGTCGRCRVRVSGRVRMLSGETVQAENRELLACRCCPDGDLEVYIIDKEAANTRIAADAVDIPGGGHGLGLAVDIGTTTIAAYLYDLETGKCLAKSSAMNAQRSYGANVISRIQHASTPEGLERLAGAVRRQIADMAGELCGDLRRINYISIAANTVMEHIFAGLNPETIGIAPFTPLSLFGREYAASEFLEGFAEDCRLYLCPAVSGYVGGDITAGLFSSGAYKSDKPVLFVDIGTNGEMAIGGRNGFLSCATAAGPAFEGAEIDCGAPAGDGAINTVADDLGYTVLGGGEPSGICGSGIIDAVAALLKNGIVDETGRMEGDYHFTPEVYVSAKDIRQIQLAKAAIRAGIKTLLGERGLGCDDISAVLVAGGFGAYMNVKSACAIGLLPPALEGKTVHIGNSAGAGAALALTAEGREAIEEICRNCGYLELSSSPEFRDNYIFSMSFEEDDDDD